MDKIFNGRFTAKTDQDFVVFIIGMRVNKWWLFHRWLPVILAMTKMLMTLQKDKSLGMRGMESFFRLFPTTTCLISYWDSFEHLDRFASDKSLPHYDAWMAFMKKAGKSGDVGIYHETYKVSQQGFECLYGNMPKFGLASAFSHEAVTPASHSAKDRIK
ncbi:MAG: DUF4188 domain-containing protein [Bdellovibrio sp.]|nr:DUF4188 domain-containing protein [Bdellovibrio sp.]